MRLHEVATRYTVIAHDGEEQIPATTRAAAIFETKLHAVGVHHPTGLPMAVLCSGSFDSATGRACS
ncbi:hypothetical protein AB0B25_06080 [Nocardia sp. NPDC049190]|uniref:hypothetical protein n=1 Tax=Nocardia sp. NPDC049190 TaxID=3155650 RepID=UPI0034010031